jgi:EAL domain-containing protein (putative c-di-GMP-specific phosphodiesterase class I)
MVSPDQFISIAEETGLITPIGDWVLRRACMDAADWPVPVKVAVNLSPMQFRNGDLVRAVESALHASGLRPQRLELEITESVLLQNDARVLTILHQLRTLGVRTVLDDFGTGYSSLSYLRSFPFDKIKVDKSFVRDMEARPDCLAIVDSVSSLASKLGMMTTAEGVETEEQLEQLRCSGFTEVQGYLLGRPQPNRSICLFHDRLEPELLAAD